MDLQLWALGLPLPRADGWARTVTQPELAGFRAPPWYDRVGADLVLAAPCGGATTRGSRYPRSELREMTATGKAAWATDRGEHRLELEGHCDLVPPVKPQVVLAQIHDGEGDVVEVLCVGRRGSADRARIVWRADGVTQDEPLDPDYRLGRGYRITLRAAAGVITLGYDGRDLAEYATVRHDCYFKAGCYVQSNPDRGDRPDAVGQVTITALRLQHGG